MAYALPNGSTIDLASSYSAPVVITSISNATTPVVSATAHGFTEGDIVLITSGWELMSNRAFVVGDVTTDTFELIGSQTDTTNLTFFPVGASGGTAKSVDSWVIIPQVTTFETTGNEQQFTEIQFLSSRRQTQLPTVKTAQTINMTVADDATQAYVPIAQAYDFDLSVNVLRWNLPTGDSVLYPSIISYNSSPTATINELMTNNLSAAVQNTETRYTRA